MGKYKKMVNKDYLDYYKMVVNNALVVPSLPNDTIVIVDKDQDKTPPSKDTNPVLYVYKAPDPQPPIVVQVDHPDELFDCLKNYINKINAQVDPDPDDFDKLELDWEELEKDLQEFFKNVPPDELEKLRESFIIPDDWLDKNEHRSCKDCKNFSFFSGRCTEGFEKYTLSCKFVKA